MCVRTLQTSDQVSKQVCHKDGVCMCLCACIQCNCVCVYRQHWMEFKNTCYSFSVQQQPVTRVCVCYGGLDTEAKCGLFIQSTVLLV